MDIFRKSLLFVSGFRRSGSNSRSFCSKRPLGEFWAKKSFNEVYVTARSSGWRRWASKVENRGVMALFSCGVLYAIYRLDWETTPYTKKNHLVFSPASMNEDSADIRFQRLKKRIGILLRPQYDEDYVRVLNITANLMDGYRRTSMEMERLQRWEIILIDLPDSTVTGSSGGGKVIFPTGLLYSAKDDAETAVYIAREIGHSVGRHTERLIALKLILANSLLGLHISFSHFAPNLMNTMPRLLKILRFPFALSVASGITWIVASRLLEKVFMLKAHREADYIGLLLVASAGYDPWEALRVRQMHEGNSTWESIRTKLLVVDMNEALAIYNEAQASSTD